MSRLPRILNLRAGLACLVLFAALAWAPDVSAQRRALRTNVDHTPSVFAYGLRGFGIGALLGLSTGYIIHRNSEWESQHVAGLATAVGIGSIAGAAAGLGVGIFDLMQRRPGVGAIVLRDTLYGTLLGILVGGAGGMVSLLAGGSAEHLLFGSAVGSLVGAGVGVIIGFIEGPRIIREYAREGSGLRLAVGTHRVGEQLVMVPSLLGHF